MGVLAAQLAVRSGATVVGTASPGNHDFLRDLGIVPVDHHGDLVANLREYAPGPVTAVLDNSGRATLDAAIAMGVPLGRINTIADRAAVAELGVLAVAGAAATTDQLVELAGLLAAGDVVLPVERTFTMDPAQQAYELLERRHVRGKIVIVPG